MGDAPTVVERRPIGNLKSSLSISLPSLGFPDLTMIKKSDVFQSLTFLLNGGYPQK